MRRCLDINTGCKNQFYQTFPSLLRNGLQDRASVGRELTLAGADVNKTKQALLSMLNSSDIKNRVTIDENNKVSFKTVGLSKDQMKDNTVVLLSNLVTAKEQYLFEVNTVAQGTDREIGEPKTYNMYNKGNTQGPIDMNFSYTDRGDEQQSLAKGVTSQNFQLANMKPASGFDGQAVVTPEKSDVEKLKGKPYGNIVFHTLQEVYTRTHDECDMPESHEQSIDCEIELPTGHPAKSDNPGKITPRQ